ncbi:MAG: energy transducer TonB, partial [Saprospiraceae bacterium]|nr:energy transducer TonB [Saprospiraceae bacterium]
LVMFLRIRIAKEKLLFNKTAWHFFSRTKNPGLDIFSYRAYFLEIGLFFSLVIIYILFQWTIEGSQLGILHETDFNEEIPEMQVVRTVFYEDVKQIAKPKLRPKDIILIEEISDEISLELLDERIEETEGLVKRTANNSRFILPPAPPVPELEEPEIPVWFAEQMPRFPGCEDLQLTDEELRICADKALLQFVNSHIKYPVVARENGIEGTVVIRFVVNKDGSITNIAILRDIAGDCGLEAQRVVQLMHDLKIKWIPGRQGGRNVPVQFSLPVKFQLQQN